MEVTKRSLPLWSKSSVMLLLQVGISIVVWCIDLDWVLEHLVALGRKYSVVSITFKLFIGSKEDTRSRFRSDSRSHSHYSRSPSSSRSHSRSYSRSRSSHRHSRRSYSRSRSRSGNRYHSESRNRDNYRPDSRTGSRRNVLVCFLCNL